jgi:hypothetical protein
MRRALALLLIGLAAPALAQIAAPVELPRERPSEAASSSNQVSMPRERPAVPGALPPPSSSEPPPEMPSEPPESEPAAPPRDFQVACPAVLNGEATAQSLPPIHEGQCGLQSPLSLEAVSANGRSIPLNAAVITDCAMATALPGWVADVDSYVFAHDNTRVASVVVGTNYACRNVNNADGGDLSFHAFGDALDVVGFTLEDGRNVTVSEGWTGSEAQGSHIIRFAHDAACTHFTTVLGPEANALHHDHVHVDLGCHGKSCVARLCE